MGSNPTMSDFDLSKPFIYDLNVFHLVASFVAGIRQYHPDGKSLSTLAIVHGFEDAPDKVIRRIILKLLETSSDSETMKAAFGVAGYSKPKYFTNSTAQAILRELAKLFRANVKIVCEDGIYTIRVRSPDYPDFVLRQDKIASKPAAVYVWIVKGPI